ncbi:putative tartrate dehydrogenase [Ustulina deusta]|nr:putative tartrate dehydrogenase [Ustulina deusta]
MAVRVHNVASIPGDGIGVEIIENTVQMLIGIEKRVGTFELKFTSFDWGSERYKELRAYMPKDGLDIIKNLMLSCSVRSGHQLEQYVNVRPIKLLPGLNSPLKNLDGGHLDWGGITHDDTPYTIANDVAVFTRHGIERTMRFAFETAASRPRKKFTMVTKSNAQRHGMVLWDKVEADKMLVDAMTVLANGIKTRDLGGESSTVENVLPTLLPTRNKLPV